MNTCNFNIDKLSILLKPYYGNNFLLEELPIEINKMIDIFQKHIQYFRVTDDNYIFSQLDNPFFLIPKTDTIDNSHVNNNSEYNMIYDKIHNTLNKINKNKVFNPYFIMLYLTINSDTKACSIGNWTLFSINQVIYDLNILISEEPAINWCTLGHKYMGLGYYQALRMNINNGKLFIQMDGGSNDWDRMSYWEQYKNQQINDSNYTEFTELINLLISNE
jgi:hypothetical protein